MESLKIDRVEPGVNHNAVFYFSLTLDEQFKIRKHDLDAKEFFGGNIGSFFYELGGTEEEKEDIKGFLEELPKKGEGRIITDLLDRNEVSHLTDIVVRYHEDSESCYEMEVWILPNLEAEFFTYRKNIWKYKTLLGQTSQSFVDYFMDDDKIAVYRYVGNRAVQLFNDTFDKFIEELIENSEKTDQNNIIIGRLKESFRMGKSKVDITLKSGIFHVDHKVQKLLFRARFDDMNGKRMMYGIISNLADTEEDLPYYMTAAGLDSATGLLSKRSIVEYSEYIFSSPATKNRKHYMALLDIDDFKGINDNFGHQIGDQAISILAATLNDVIRDNGIVGRYGGDEFFILTDRIEDEESLRSLLRRIRAKALSLAKETLGMEKFTISIGVVEYPANGDNYKDLLALADKCLYIAKEKGKNRYVIYRPEIHSDIKTGVKVKGISSYDEQSKSINRVVKQLFIEGGKAIEESIADITKSFDLDCIDVFYKDSETPIFSGGKYPSGFSMSDFTKDGEYMSKFDENGVFVLNNHTNLRHTHERLFDLLESRQCMSLIQVALPNEKNPEYFFNCNMLNRIHKWSDAEVSNLGLFGSLIYGVLKKEEK